MSLSLLAAVVVWLVSTIASAEVVHLKNGDILHGSVISVNSREITLETPYGRLKIPKKDIQRIDYEQSEEVEKSPKKKTRESKPAPKPKLVIKAPKADLPATTTRSTISMEIRGRSFWYAFVSPTENPADLSIRLRIFMGDVEAAMLLDTKPDTVDGDTYYNSFTFSPTDSKVMRTGSGFDCIVTEAEDGKVTLSLQLPEGQSAGRYLIRMIYQVNEGDRQFPRWIDAVSRGFNIQVEPGMESRVVLQQDASALDYSGFFRKTMKNVESFRLEVLSSEVIEPSQDPEL
jgi:hypothetical protein